MKILVWHWGRRGAGPRFARDLAAGFARLPGTTAWLCLAEGTELAPPAGTLTVPTYRSRRGLLCRMATSPLLLRRIERTLEQDRPDLAVCAMPALLDPIMLIAARRRGVPTALIVHDAAAHEGEPHPARSLAEAWTRREADHLFTLSHAVANNLARCAGAPVTPLFHPPFDFGPMPETRAHGGRLRVLSFGRLLPYKGLDLLSKTLERLDPEQVEAWVVGQGPETGELTKLCSLRHVRVENRWIPETELPALLAWADVVLLTHRAASQSGVAAAAWGSGRYLVGADTPGLAEQLRAIPGAVVAPPNPDGLAHAVCAIASTKPPGQPDAESLWRELAGAIQNGASVRRLATANTLRHIAAAGGQALR